MRTLVIFTVFLVVIVCTCAWEDYTDYYDDNDYQYQIPKFKEIETYIGSEVYLDCDAYSFVSFWKHHLRDYYPGTTDLPNIVWLDDKNLKINITSEEDAGTWECWDFDAPIATYEITIKQRSNTTTTTSTTTVRSELATYAILDNSSNLEISSTTDPPPPTTKTSIVISSSPLITMKSSTTSSAQSTGESVYIVSSSTTRPSSSNLKTGELDGEEELLGFMFMKAASNSLKNPFIKGTFSTIKSSALSLEVPYMTLFTLLVLKIYLLNR